MDLEAALDRAQAASKTLADALERAAREHSEAEKVLAETRASEAAIGKSLKVAVRRARKAEGRFSKRLEAAGFESREAYEAAKLDESGVRSLTAEIEEHEAGRRAAGLRLTRARQATRGRRRPDLKTLERRADEAKSRCDEKIAAVAEMRKEHKLLVDLDAELDRVERKAKALERKYYVTGRIAEVANGKNAQRITFQRFVLATLLDDVLLAANDRLKLMSRGRFNLQRAAEGPDRRTAGGLDLEVYDAFTGTTRPVSTLSGGETFLAALSLALGLADVVQAYAGGIHLETIFIDEGFGSLDPESLDLSVRALMDLQKGNRLVGIISHVPELKERIDVRLEVRPTRRGSTSRFVGIPGDPG
jgi:exonuclease SbcC